MDEACWQPFQPSELERDIRPMRSKGVPARATYHLPFLKGWANEQKASVKDIQLQLRDRDLTTNRENSRNFATEDGRKAAGGHRILQVVSLTSCVANTMERMIHNRRYYLTETRGWLGPEQASIRASRR